MNSTTKKAYKRTKERITRDFLVMSSFLGMGFTAVVFSVEAMRSFWAASAFLLSVVFGWILLRKHQHVWAGIVVNSALLLSVGWLVLFSGGFHSPFLIWLSCPPVIIGLLINWRWSLVFGATISFFAIFLKLNAHDVTQFSEFDVVHYQDMSHSIAFFSLVAAVFTILFFTYENDRIQKSALSTARISARTDALTGALNRTGFNRMIEILAQNKDGHSGSIILFDVDKFKGVNDRFGHMAGDAALQEIAAAVRNVIRSNDLLARIGGDEFAVILPSASYQQASMVGERIILAVREIELFSPSKERIHISVSVGVATCEDPQLCKVEPMMHLADAALYEAKDSPKKVCIKRLEDFSALINISPRQV